MTTYYYSDEINDEVIPPVKNLVKIDENYNYGANSFLWNLKHFIIYRVFAIPLSFLYLKFHYHFQFKNIKVMRRYKLKAFFMYGNHTNEVADALIPSMLQFPNSTFVFVNAANMSIPVLGKLNPYLGAIPLPDTLAATKNFSNYIQKRITQKHTITIYPEAHVWPFYTKIRNFPDLSFRYPVQHKTPVFSFTNTYQKRKIGKTPKIVTYIDGPFFPDENLTGKEQRKKLRDQVYYVMCERAKNNNVEINEYIKTEKKEN